MPSADYIRLRHAIQYTGLNGLEVAIFAGIDVISDNGSVLQLGRLTPLDVFYNLGIGDWYEVVDGVPWVTSSFPAEHISKAIAIHGSQSDIVSISIPLLIAGASVDRPVAWARPFTNLNYDLSYALDRNMIGNVTCTEVAGTRTLTGITIRTTANLAVSTTGVIHVYATGS